MPPRTIFDISGIDLDAVLHDREVIRQYNPQRGAMEHLDAIVWADEESASIIGRKNVRDDEFWVPGHIPGRPLLPGVIMIEAAAQVASFYTRRYMGWTGFVGFGGVDACKFRQQVVPGDTLIILCQRIWERHRRVCCNTQGLVRGNLAFECQIVGTQL
jgi:3-hydroxyacyl-[acyl-carrier-protein] dehydratase